MISLYARFVAQTLSKSYNKKPYPKQNSLSQPSLSNNSSSSSSNSSSPSSFLEVYQCKHSLSSLQALVFNSSKWEAFHLWLDSNKWQTILSQTRMKQTPSNSKWTIIKHNRITTCLRCNNKCLVVFSIHFNFQWLSKLSHLQCRTTLIMVNPVDLLNQWPFLMEQEDSLKSRPSTSMQTVNKSRITKVLLPASLSLMSKTRTTFRWTSVVTQINQTKTRWTLSKCSKIWCKTWCKIWKASNHAVCPKNFWTVFHQWQKVKSQIATSVSKKSKEEKITIRVLNYLVVMLSIKLVSVFG